MIQAQHIFVLTLIKKALVLFGSHTTPEKVSIETDNFKSLKANNLKDLTCWLMFLKKLKKI